MRKLGLVLCLGLAVSGCARLAQSPLNPVNWFGPATEEPATVEEIRARKPILPPNRTRIVEGRPLVQSVSEMEVIRTPSGALVRATGVVPTQGFFNAELVNAGTENGVLTFDFRAEAPAGFEAAGSDLSRRITAAEVLSGDDLDGVRTIRVRAANNARSARR